MNRYYVQVVADIPYPVQKQIQSEACTFAVAVKRAIRAFRELLKAEGRGRKRIKQLRITATKL